MKFDWSKVNFSDAFLQPAVLKIWGLAIIVGFSLLIFRVLLERGVATYFKKHSPKKVKTPTLILIGIFLAFLLVAFWNFF